MDTNIKNQDVLLVKEKGSNKLQIAKMDKDGNPKHAKSQNPDFLKIDRNGFALENFFENFARQTKDPTRFEFFLIPAEKFPEVIDKLKEAFKNPNTPENRDYIELHRINPADFQKSQQSQYAPIDVNRVDAAKLENIGVTLEMLEKTGNLEKLLNWQKTNLLPIYIKNDDEPIRTEARLALREDPEGNLKLSVHSLQSKPELERPYFGIKFTDEDKKNLLTTGNLGRIAEAEYKPGIKTPVFISIDRQTNELVAVRAEKVKIPDKICGVQLSEQQQKELSEGKSVWVEGMISKKGNEFSAYLQFNADTKKIEFRFDKEKQNQQQSQSSQQSHEIPKTFRQKPLTEDQRASLQEGKTVYVDGLKDKKGKPYSGYITMNKETGKLDFMFPPEYKKALAEGKIIPDNRHKTQVAVNSEGKTNEATKNVKEPLQKGQTQPTEKQAEKQKSKGVKM